MNSKILKHTIVVLVAALTTAGCSKNEEETGRGPLSSTDTLLAYVPADSPYVIASVQPLPDPLFDKLEPKLDNLLTAYRAAATAFLQSAMSGAESGGDDEADRARADNVAEALSSLLSVEGLRDAGLDRRSTAVFYGNGLLPVLRIRLSDADLFEQAVKRVESAAGEGMPSAELGDVTYRYLDAENAKVILATVENDLVLTVAPEAFGEEQLGQLIGLGPLSNNIARAGVLQDLAEENGFTGHYVGYVDIIALAGTVFGEAAGLNADLLRLLPADRPEPSAVCKAEYLELAGIVPRVVMGYTSVSADRLDAKVLMEVRSDIASGLATLTAAVPGLGGDEGTLLSFGMSLDAMAARQFYEARLDALAADPFECPDLAPFQQSVEAGRMALQQPVPPIAYDVRGFLAVVENFGGMDLATGTPPTEIEARFLLAMRNAPALLQLGAMFSPELDALDVQPDAKPVRLNLPDMAGLGGDTWVAMNENAIALAIGEGQELELASMLAAPDSGDGMFLSFSMDALRYYAFLGEAVSVAEQEENQGESMPEEVRQAVSDVMAASGRFYDRMSADVRLTSRGVEVTVITTLQD